MRAEVAAHHLQSATVVLPGAHAFGGRHVRLVAVEEQSDRERGRLDAPGSAEGRRQLLGLPRSVPIHAGLRPKGLVEPSASEPEEELSQLGGEQHRGVEDRKQ